MSKFNYIGNNKKLIAMSALKNIKRQQTKYAINCNNLVCCWGVIVSKLVSQIIISEFYPYWMFHTCSLVLKLSCA